jgi:hypothetical protein
MDPRACELRGREPKGGHCDRTAIVTLGLLGKGGSSGVLKPDRTTLSQPSTPLPPRPTPGRVRTGQSGRLRPSRRLQASFAQAVRALAFSHWFPLRLFRRRGAAL